MFCPHCGKEVAEEQVFCQHCGSSLTPPAGAAEETRSRTPWEERHDIGFFNGLFRTLKETLLAPSAFFRKMPVTGGLTDPLLYALFVGMAGLMVFYLWDVLLRDPMQSFMSPQFRAASERNALYSRGGPFFAVLTPFFLLFWLFIISGIQHVILSVIRGAQAGFEATFRVVSYSISPFVFLMVPLCGMPVASTWMLVLTIIGLKEAHRISGGKAAFAVLFPFFLCCGLFLLVIALFLSAIVATFGGILQSYR
jgi:hypothetical protein